MNLLQKLGKKPIFFDGAMGTMLQNAGLMPGELPELWNFSHSDTVFEIHKSYRNAGADILKSNTFGANRFKLAGCGYSVEEVVSRGVSLAKKAAGGDAWTALDIGPTGKLLKPLGDLDFEDAVSAFREMAAAGEKAGADCILIETMSDIYEAKAAALAAKESSSLPVFVTMTFDMDGALLTGGSLEVMAAVLEGLRVNAIGLNCGLGPRQMLSLTEQLRTMTSLPIIVNPNAGLPREENGGTVYDVDAEVFSKYMADIVSAGASCIGGCCGTTPAHISAMVKACSGLSCRKSQKGEKTVVTSGIHAVSFGDFPVVIGERINPTGKPKLKAALREHDISYLLSEGIKQQDAGAHILDVNVGLPEIDEPSLMCEAITAIQAISPLPLQIDTADPETMEKAMRIYNGKPLVNSVTAKRSSMDAIFPLVQKYGGVVIGLTITEKGIPETAEERLKAAKTIVSAAESYGISKTDIIIDPLTMAISAGQDAALVTLAALRKIHEELGVFTSLGVSNVSFGLPQRENITASFFLMALTNGLSAAIMNPNSEKMMQAYRSFCALSAKDKNCMKYIAAYSQENTAPPSQEDAAKLSLGDAIEKGLKQEASNIAGKLVEDGVPGLEIINSHIVPALDRVGECFEKKTLFLPQLLMSADAAKAAFGKIREHMEKGGSGKNGALTIVIATVLGDVHDIGKNIVKVLLENYGFAVIDLGKDVPPEAVLKAVRENHAALVGLSALMTTTVTNMKATVELLHKEEPNCKIMVGGAVLTQEYADAIGADFYGKDAMASVRYASELAAKLS